MPSDQSTWLIAIPHDGDSEGTLQELHSKLASQSKTAPGVAQIPIPTFKVCASLSTCMTIPNSIGCELRSDRDFGVSHLALRGHSEAGYVLH